MSASQKKNGWRSFRKGLWTFQSPKSHFESRACNKQRWAIKAWGRHSPRGPQIHSLPACGSQVLTIRMWATTWVCFVCLFVGSLMTSRNTQWADTNSSCLEDKALRLLQTEIVHAHCPHSSIRTAMVVVAQQEQRERWRGGVRTGVFLAGKARSWGLRCFCLIVFL